MIHCCDSITHQGENFQPDSISKGGRIHPRKRGASKMFADICSLPNNTEKIFSVYPLLFLLVSSCMIRFQRLTPPLCGLILSKQRRLNYSHQITDNFLKFSPELLFRERGSNHFH
jgi:hypothetical protein